MRPFTPIRFVGYCSCYHRWHEEQCETLAELNRGDDDVGELLGDVSATLIESRTVRGHQAGKNCQQHHCHPFIVGCDESEASEKNGDDSAGDGVEDEHFGFWVVWSGK